MQKYYEERVDITLFLLKTIQVVRNVLVKWLNFIYR